MEERVKIRDDILGDMIFRRIEESGNPNIITYILELKDGRFSRIQRMKRYNLGGRKIITPRDMMNKNLEVEEMKSALKQMLDALKTSELQLKGYKPILTKLK
jgi:hypothetical protein